jgi:hypothetical protein
MKKETKHKAILTITEFPKTVRGKEKMANWIFKVGQQVLDAKPDEYAELCRFRMMK